MQMVKFYKDVSLGWPASDTWYLFLKALHERLSQAERMGYSDKDIMLVSEIRFDEGENGYQRPGSLIVQFHRFNERNQMSTILPATLKRANTFRIALEMPWNGYIVTGFSYERLEV